MISATAFCDGGIRGPNPGGISACAAVLYLDGNREPVSRARALSGKAQTNNTAEVSGLLLALELATEHGVDDLAIRSDSKLVVEQALGTWRVKNTHLRELHARAALMAGQLASVRISHVRREHNRHADRICAELLDELTGRRRGY